MPLQLEVGDVEEDLHSLWGHYVPDTFPIVWVVIGEVRAGDHTHTGQEGPTAHCKQDKVLERNLQSPYDEATGPKQTTRTPTSQKGPQCD